MKICHGTEEVKVNQISLFWSKGKEDNIFRVVWSVALSVYCDPAALPFILKTNNSFQSFGYKGAI